MLAHAYLRNPPCRPVNPSTEKSALADELEAMGECLVTLAAVLRKDYPLSEGIPKVIEKEITQHKTKAKLYYQLVKLQETK